MASGHVNRANRPNTWPHRPMLQSEESPCQLGAVHTWGSGVRISSGAPPNKFNGLHHILATLVTAISESGFRTPDAVHATHHRWEGAGQIVVLDPASI